MVNVFTLLYARKEEDIQGNMMLFDTVRIGFPNVNIHIFSNKNTPDFDREVTIKSKGINCNCYSLNIEVKPADFINFLIQTEQEPFYLIDPDTIWFEEMPTSFKSPLAGRYTPKFYDKFSKAVTHSRLHTSCLYIDPVKVRNLLNKSSKLAFNPIHEETYYLEGTLYRFDTCSKLYHYLMSNCEEFAEDINKKYAHLFCGTNISEIKEYYPELVEVHKLSRSSIEYAKRLHKQQNDYFVKMGV